ncbi:hypothetical protein BASA60_006139 [Batrachochytrium salamandrivorans]|nr:hypothetical protein BASA60_006139 [Batrachochytrium salamandrivorans]
MKVAAATILSLVATAAYASPTAYSETQEVGTHDSTAESSSDSYLEKRGGGFYGNYAQGAGGVHNAQFNHWNHRSHETGGHHQYPQTHSSPRLYGPNQWRHTPVSRDLGPYEKLRQKQQEQQQQYQQYQQRRQQHDQQQQQYQQHHQQQHQQQSALQQYQQQRQQQRQQQQQEQQQRLEQYQRQHQQRQHEQRQRQENNYRFSPYEMLRHKQQQQRQQQQQYHQQQENSSPYNQYGVHRQYNHQPQSWGSRGTSSSHGMNQHAQQPHYWKDRGPSSQYGVRHQYTQPLQYQEDRGTSSSPEMNQNAQPVEGGNNGAGVDAETEETVKVELGGESNTGNNNPEGGNGGPEVQPENDNNPKSGTSGSDAEAASDESGDKSTGPADSTKTGESGEVKSEGGANGGEPEAKESFVGSGNNNPEGGNGGPEVQPENDNNPKSGTSGSNAETASGESGDKSTGPADVKPENDNNPKSGTSGSDAETASGESGDKVTGPGDSTGTEENVEVKTKVELRAVNLKPERYKLEDGAAKPENDRDSAFKLPWDSVLDDQCRHWVTALDPGVENVYTWLCGGVLNGEADLDQRWLDGTVEHESMGTRHDNRALAARLADFLQVAYRQYQSTLWKYHRDRLVGVG